MRRILLFLVVFVMYLYSHATFLFAQQTYYVQSLKARVMTTPSFKGKPLTKLGKGFKLTVLGKEGTWLKVKFGSSQGYLPALLLSPKPPLEKQGLIKGEEDVLQHGVRRRASTYTSAAAARGLTQDDRRRLSRDEKVDYESLEKIESVSVSPEEVTRFMEESRL
jgi:uncharacterized protein YgiM (DUF1202 family)